MCLIIHKPEHATLPPLLLESAAKFNPHGYGFVVFNRDGGFSISKQKDTSIRRLNHLYNKHRDDECVIHLRYGTSGVADHTNTHPVRVTRDIYLAHNGTLNLGRHDPDRSDTWHLVNDYLKPILSRRPQLLHDPFFQDSVSSWLGPQNRLVFIDKSTQKVVIINRDQGFEVNGVWLSNTRWFDPSHHPWRISKATSGKAPWLTRFAV
jgi:hypothetical protein